MRLGSTYPAALAYPGASTFSVEPGWQSLWRDDAYLGDPNRPRLANIYPGLGTAGVVSPLPGGHPAQDVTIHASGVATFLRQVRIMLDAVSRGTEVERLLAEIMLNDYCALWELLFVSGVKNEHGNVDLCVLDHWTNDRWKGASCLAALKNAPHPDLDAWRQTRNKVTAHVDADADIWKADTKHWPMTVDALIDEAGRVINALRKCAQSEIRSDIFFAPPKHFGKEVVGLANQQGRYWKDG